MSNENGAALHSEVMKLHMFCVKNPAFASALLVSTSLMIHSINAMNCRLDRLAEDNRSLRMKVIAKSKLTKNKKGRRVK